MMRVIMTGVNKRVANEDTTVELMQTYKRYRAYDRYLGIVISYIRFQYCIIRSVISHSIVDTKDDSIIYCVVDESY